MLYTHYDYLELPPGASSTCIEVAYHTLKQRLNGDAEEMLVRLIHEAYAVLSDPDRRRVYDTALQRAATDADAELTSGRIISASDVRFLTNIHRYMEDRFDRHLNLLRSRSARK